MAGISRAWRLSAVSLAAAGGAFKISREISSKTKETTPESNLELVLVQMAFRHGARTPVFRPPCEELELVTWTADLLGTLPHTDVAYELKHVSGGPCPVSESKERLLKRLLKGGIPAGQLTKVGQQQMYELGKKRGKLYVDNLKFLQETYHPEEIYTRTSDFQRTIDSARCVLAGMFGKERLKELTMYTEHEEKEFLYPNVSHCKALKNCWKYFQHAKGLDHIKGFDDRQEKLEQALNMNGDNKLSSIHLKDIVSAMMAHNMEVPKNILQNLNLIEEQALQLFLSLQYGVNSGNSKKILSLGIGLFLEHIMDNFIKKIDGKHNYKMMLYSAHDVTLAPILMLLGVLDDKWPDFAADIAFELYRDKDRQYYIRVLYKGEEKVLPGCSGPLCPLNKLSVTCNDGVGDDGDVDYRDTNKACNEKNGKGNDGHLSIVG
ncbi:unnamed protein product [Porites evermanni]|uniref:Lysophosphatidic acid phosphatase type 6 n=1 Tax=Porites evermanni TaxID=104178 RepID=A0ABN8LED8_9CNID|nr:unnamed protein product [Porites evermanni]